MNIPAAIRKELNDLNILETTRTITTDGAANMLKMGDMLFGSDKPVHCKYSETPVSEHLSNMINLLY